MRCFLLLVTIILLIPINSFGEFDRIPVVAGYETVGRVTVQNLFNHPLFSDISAIELTKVSWRDVPNFHDRNCSYLAVLDKDKGRIFFSHMDGYNSGDYNEGWVKGGTGSGAYQLYQPEDMVAFTWDFDGGWGNTSIYIADTGNHRIKRAVAKSHNNLPYGDWSDFDLYPDNIGEDYLISPTGISCAQISDTPGNIERWLFIADLGLRKVVVMDTGGEILEELDESTLNVGSFFPWKVASWHDLEADITYLSVLSRAGKSGRQANVSFLSKENGEWSINGTESISDAKNVSFSPKSGFLVLGEGAIYHYSKTGDFLEESDLTEFCGPGVTVTDIATSGNDYLFSQTYTDYSGLARARYQGTVQFATTEKQIYIQDDDDTVHVDFSVSYQDQYTVVVTSPPYFVLQVPGVSGTVFSPGVHSFDIEAADLDSDIEEYVVSVYPHDGTNEDGMQDSFYYLQRPSGFMIAPNDTWVTGEDGGMVVYQLDSPSSHMEAFHTEAFLTFSGQLFHEPIGEKLENQSETGWGLTFPVVYPMPSLAFLGSVFEIGFRTKFSLPEGGIYEFVTEPNRMSSIRIYGPHIPDVNPRPDIKISPVNGKFANGKGLMIFPNPVKMGAKLYVASGSATLVKLYDIKGRCVGEIHPTEAFTNYWEASFDPGLFGLSSGIYFAAVEQGGERQIEKMVYVK